MKKLGLLILFLWYTAAAGWSSDLTITFQNQMQGMTGTRISRQTHYYTSRYQMICDATNQIDHLVDYETGSIYLINHGQKKISKSKLGLITKELEADIKDGTPLPNFFGDPNSCEVTNPGKGMVAGRNCSIYRIRVGKITVTIWADPALVPPNPKGYDEVNQSQAEVLEKAGPAALVFKRLQKEARKIKGIPLKTAMSSATGLNNVSEAIQIQEGPVEAKTFALPDYSTEDTGKKLKEQAGKSAK